MDDLKRLQAEDDGVHVRAHTSLSAGLLAFLFQVARVQRQSDTQTNVN